jgi:hypothetical protein
LARHELRQQKCFHTERNKKGPLTRPLLFHDAGLVRASETPGAAASGQQSRDQYDCQRDEEHLRDENAQSAEQEHQQE